MTTFVQTLPLEWREMEALGNVMTSVDPSDSFLQKAEDPKATLV